MSLEYRKYLIISTSELHLVDFAITEDTSLETVRKSLDGSLCIIEWLGNNPDFINNIIIKEGPYTADQISYIVSGENWVDTRELHPQT